MGVGGGRGVELEEKGRRGVAVAAATCTKEVTKWKANLPKGPVVPSSYPFPAVAKEKGRKGVRNNIHYFSKLSVIRDRRVRIPLLDLHPKLPNGVTYRTGESTFFLPLM